MFSRWLPKAQSGRREATEGPTEDLGADRVPPSNCSLDALDDETLAARLVAGEHEALSILFQRHSALVFRIARRMLRNDGEAEEALQQVFLDAYRAVANFDPHKGSFKVWLLQYAYTRTLNRLNRLKSQHFYEWENLESEIPVVDRYDYRLQLSRTEIGHLIGELLNGLDPSQKRIIELTYFKGLTAKEISQLTGETPSVVRHNLYRGMSLLRQALEQQKQLQRAERTTDERKEIVFALEAREL